MFGIQHLKFKPWTKKFFFPNDDTQMQGILVPKLTLGPFLTRNGPNLQSYLFQEYISLNPRRVEQNYTTYLLKKWPIY